MGSNAHIFDNTFPVNIYLFKVNNRNTSKTCEICSKLTIKAPFSCVFIVNFEQVNVNWVFTVSISRSEYYFHINLRKKKMHYHEIEF